MTPIVRRQSRRPPESLDRCIKGKAGNVTVVAALAMFVMVGTIGAAVDYIRMTDQQTAVSSAADSAALAAIAAANTSTANGDTVETSQSIAAATAQRFWVQNVGDRLDSAAGAPAFNIHHEDKTWTAEVSFDGHYQTAFMVLLGIDTMRLHAYAKAVSPTSKTRTHWQYTLAVDTSNSMGIGGTQDDMNALLANRSINCMFACHSTSGIYKDTVAIAHKAGITLRIDYVVAAVRSVIGEMQALDEEGYIEAQLVGMDRDMTTLVAMTADLQKIETYDLQLTAARVDRTNMSTGDSDYKVSFASLAKLVGTAGDGSSADQPRKAVFIITDGIHDSYSSQSNAVVHWSSYHHYLGPLDPAFCDTMKANGVTVGLLYIDYIPPGYEYLIEPYKADVLPKLKACTSDNMFYNATSPEGLKDALLDMLDATLNDPTPRLTQ